MRTLCPHCGKTTTHRWQVMPPRCVTCKRRLPPAIPRGLVYAARTLWRPLLILILAAGLFLVSPYSGPHRLALPQLEPISASAYKIPPASHTPR